MKKLSFFCLVLITALTMSFHFSSCSNADANKVDVVNGVQPFDVHDITWRKEFIASLKPLTPEQRRQRIDDVLPHLNASLVSTLRENGLDCEIKSITYMFGSGTAKGVSSGDGEKYDGTYEDQLYAVVKGGKCFGDSVVAFVQCFNGVFSLKGKNNDVIGTYYPSFTIEKNKGINYYVDYQTAIWLAECFDIPLYKGQGWSGPSVTPKEAREMENNLDNVQVTVRVNEGDHFDLGNMTYTHNGAVTYAKK
ncbi:MAG TPA: hypothetical protein VG982_01845 [Candidatus Paceibacterota bacterium]|nr:hypothetical protein [Candidatus Paceibacterota bacterium]